MKISRLPVILLGVALLCAQTPAPPLTPQQLASVVASSIRVRQRNLDITVLPDGRLVTLNTMKVEVLSAAFAHSAQIPASYNATLEDIEIPQAYTLKANGQKIAVDPSVILTQRPAATDTMAPVYSDREQKLVIFPQVEPGDTLVLVSRTTQKAAVIPGQFTLAIYPNDTLPVDDAVYSLTAPAAMAMYADSTWPRETSRQGDTVTWRWHQVGTPAAASPPPLFDPVKAPHLLVSSFKDHEVFGHAYAAMVKDKIAVTPAIQKQADLIAGGLTDSKAVARAIYDWVGRNVRYVAIELGAGGIIPHDAEWTLNNRFGDCKDHALLFASLLKARGIDAQLVLINATNRYRLGPVPTIGDFNHVITWLPELNLYADTTLAWLPFGQLPPGDSGKPVLHVVETGTARHQTPAEPDGALTSSYTVRAVMNEQGGMVLDMTTKASGAWAASLRRLDENFRGYGADLAARRILTQRNFPNATGTLMPGSGDDETYQITGTARLGRPAPTANLMALANALELMTRAGDGLAGPLGNRALTAADDTPCYSGHQSEDIAITFRPGTRPGQVVPADVHLKTAHLSYDTSWKVEGDTITLHRDFVSRMQEPVCTGAVRRETAEALEKIRADYGVAVRPPAVNPGPPPPPPVLQ